MNVLYQLRTVIQTQPAPTVMDLFIYTCNSGYNGNGTVCQGI